MKMIRDQGPGKTPSFGFFHNFAKPMDKIVAILIVMKYDSALNSPRDNVMYGSRGIYSGFSWHAVSIAMCESVVNIEI